MTAYERYGKRILDLIIAVTAMVLLSPVILLIMLIYILTFSFPLFYRQVRIGKDGRLFSLLKFRTLKNSESSALQSRRFLYGDILRFTSLDELPQLFHVLGGTMSCVGPRPLPAEYMPLFSAAQQQRHTVRPGITGWAQVNGRHSVSWAEKLQLDAEYVTRVSFGFDLMILIKTAVILFSFKKDVSLHEEKFTGNP